MRIDSMELKFLTWNIQAAIGTKAYYQYVTQAHRQLLHVPSKDKTLKKMGLLIANYDVIALQEVDLGGRRSNFQSQFDRIKTVSKLPYGAVQENRKVGNISRHSNALLSRYTISKQSSLTLPGSRAGRGALIARIEAPTPFYAVNTHLSLGEADQREQLQFIAENMPDDAPFILMGDLNCGAQSNPVIKFLEKTGGHTLTHNGHKSYPSWSPSYDYDHIIMGPHFGAKNLASFTSIEPVVMDSDLSDHRPVALDFSVG